MAKTKKQMERLDVSNVIISSSVYLTGSELALRTIVVQPREIKKRAGRSYFKTNLSPRYFVDSIRLTIMATDALQAIKVKSRYGRTIRWMIAAMNRHTKPAIHLH